MQNWSVWVCLNKRRVLFINDFSFVQLRVHNAQCYACMHLLAIIEKYPLVVLHCSSIVNRNNSNNKKVNIVAIFKCMRPINLTSQWKKKKTRNKTSANMNQYLFVSLLNFSFKTMQNINCSGKWSERIKQISLAYSSQCHNSAVTRVKSLVNARQTSISSHTVIRSETRHFLYVFCYVMNLLCYISTGFYTERWTVYTIFIDKS